MEQGSEAVRRLEAAIGLGFSLSEAVQKALGCSLTQWAEANGHRQSEVSMCLGGYHQRAYPAIREALARDLAVEREDLDRLIEAQKPAAEEVA